MKMDSYESTKLKKSKSSQDYVRIGKMGCKKPYQQQMRISKGLGLSIWRKTRKDKTRVLKEWEKREKKKDLRIICK
jgi:hypothetical protein